jgi:hypothetical protein
MEVRGHRHLSHGVNEVRCVCAAAGMATVTATALARRHDGLDATVRHALASNWAHNGGGGGGDLSQQRHCKSPRQQEAARRSG